MKKVMAKGPSEMKGQSGKAHRGIKGPSEMHAAGAAGPKHKGIKGPGSMKEPMLGKEKVVHTADMAGNLSHLGDHGSASNLKQGHKSLEKVSPGKLGMIQPADDKKGDADGDRGGEY